jgi:hypothetical protein
MLRRFTNTGLPLSILYTEEICELLSGYVIHKFRPRTEYYDAPDKFHNTVRDFLIR